MSSDPSDCDPNVRYVDCCGVPRLSVQACTCVFMFTLNFQHIANPSPDILSFRQRFIISGQVPLFEHAVWHERVNEHVRLTVEKFGVPLEHLQTCLVEF